MHMEFITWYKNYKDQKLHGPMIGDCGGACSIFLYSKIIFLPNLVWTS